MRESKTTCDMCGASIPYGNLFTARISNFAAKTAAEKDACNECSLKVGAMLKLVPKDWIQWKTA